VSSLFLLGVGLVSLGLRALLADTDETGLGAGITELAVSVFGGLVVSDGALLELLNVLDRQDRGGAGDGVALGGLDVLGGSVTLLGLAVAAGEEDEAVSVLLEALDIGLEALQSLLATVSRD
jgi:hypothetical protein